MLSCNLRITSSARSARRPQALLNLSPLQGEGNIFQTQDDEYKPYTLNITEELTIYANEGETVVFVPLKRTSAKKSLLMKMRRIILDREARLKGNQVQKEVAEIAEGRDEIQSVQGIRQAPKSLSTNTTNGGVRIGLECENQDT